MKKIVAAALFFLFPLVAVFAVPDLRVSLPSAGSKVQYPVDADLGECSDVSKSESHLLLIEAFRKPYSLEWAEEYLHETYKKSIARLYSQLLSEILPTRNVLLSKAMKYSDGSEVIVAKFPAPSAGGDSTHDTGSVGGAEAGLSAGSGAVGADADAPRIVSFAVMDGKICAILI